AASGQPGGLTGTRQRRVVCLAPKPGALVVDRGVDLRGALEPRPELTRAGMEPAPIRRRDRAVQRITEELVPEVIQAAKAGRIKDELVDQLLERRLERPRRDVHDAGQDVGHEAATDDRTGARRGLGL